MYSNENGYQNGSYQNGNHRNKTHQDESRANYQSGDGHDPKSRAGWGPSMAGRPGRGWGFAALMRDLVTTWRLLWDPQVPGLLKICIPFLALIYFIWPLDLMPGLPFDDIAIVLLAARMFVRLAPQDRVYRAYPGGDAAQSDYYSFRNRHTRNGDTNDDADVIDTTWHVVDDK